MCQANFKEQLKEEQLSNLIVPFPGMLAEHGDGRTTMMSCKNGGMLAQYGDERTTMMSCKNGGMLAQYGDERTTMMSCKNGGVLAQYGDERTTIMLRNIPNAYSPSMLVELLELSGFRCKFDFVYLPIDFRTGVNLGYAFVNLASNIDAQQVIDCFHGFHDWACESQKVCEVSWANPHQGLADHVERYRNSPVMHDHMPDEYKPRLYVNGLRIPFPEPTKRIRPPRVRPQRRA